MYKSCCVMLVDFPKKTKTNWIRFFLWIINVTVEFYGGVVLRGRDNEFYVTLNLIAIY